MLVYLVEGVELRLIDREEVTKPEEPKRAGLELEEPKPKGVELRLVDREEVTKLVVLLDGY